MTNSINIAADNLNSMAEIIKTLNSMSLTGEINEAIMELSNKLIIANTQHSAILQRINDLEKKLMTTKTWGKEQKKYELISP